MGVNYFQRKTGSAPVLEPAPLAPEPAPFTDFELKIYQPKPCQLLDLHHRSGRILPAVVRTMPVNRFPYLSRVLVITVLTYGEAALCSLKDNLSTLCFRPSLFERADLQRDMVNFGRCLTKG